MSGSGDDDDDLFVVFNEPTETGGAAPPHAGALSTVGAGDGAITAASSSPRAAVASPVLSDATNHGVRTPAKPVMLKAPPPSATPAPAAPPNAPSSSAGMTVLRAAHPSQSNDGTLHGLAALRALPAEYEEPNSRIRVRHGTAALAQLPLWVAQHPVVSFAVARQRLASGAGGGGPLNNSCIGVVTRKTDPKSGAKGNRYQVCTLWSMPPGAASPTADTELAVLLCGAAFDALSSQLCTGTVVAVGPLCGPKSSPSPSSPGGGGGPLVCVSSAEQVQVLGYACDLGTCKGARKNSGEPCTALVNTRASAYCHYHVGNLRSVARGTAGFIGRPTTGGKSAAVHAPAAATVTRMRPSSAPGVGASSVMLSSGAVLTQRAPPLQTLQLRQQQRHGGFLTVSGRSGLPTGGLAASRASDTGTYAGVTATTPLPVAALTDLQLPGSVAAGGRGASLRALGVTSKGRQTLEATRQQALASQQDQLLRRAFATVNSGDLRPAVPPADAQRKRPRPADAPGAFAAAAAPAVDVAARPTRTRPCPFAPLEQCGADRVVLRRDNYGASAVLSSSAAGGDGRRSGLVAAVAQAHSADLLQVKRRAGAADAGAGVNTHASLIGRLADAVDTSYARERTEEEVRRLMTYFDKAIEQQAAYDQLACVTQVEVTAFYCHTCSRLYGAAPADCKARGHRLERRKAQRHYVACRSCGYKTSCLGDATRSLGNCPRCRQCAGWAKSNAAPELARDSAAFIAAEQARAGEGGDGGEE